MQREFGIEEAISRGWNLTIRHFFGFALLLLVSLVIHTAAEKIGDRGRDLGTVLGTPLRLFGWVLKTAVGLLLTWCALHLFDSADFHLGRLLDSGARALNFFLSQILYQLIIVGGLILLIVPGIIWAIQFQFAGLLTLDQGLGPVEALKRSSEITRGVRGHLFTYALAIIGINCLGALALLLGLFWSIPTSMVATVYVYRRLLARVPQPFPPVGPVDAGYGVGSTLPPRYSDKNGSTAL